MATITDWEGRTVSGAMREVPELWQAVNVQGAGFLYYKAGHGDTYAIVEYDHRSQGWRWRLHAHSVVEVAHNLYNKPAKTALQGVRAVQRAAKRHRVEIYFG